MHCPKCGEPLVSGEARFCRLCGFALEEVKALLAIDSRNAKAQRERARQKAFKQTMLLTIVSIWMVFINLALRDLFSVPQIYGKMIIVIILTTAIVRMVLPDALTCAISNQRATRRHAKTTANLLSQQESISDNRAVNTAKSFPPQSIIERTTKLFEDQPD
jgi:uncharacterized membrane protein YvbJ